MTMQVKSSAFAEGAAIPKLYSCEDQDVSPELVWSGAPKGTQSFALIVDDPDAPAGTWVHWLIWNLPATVSSLPQDLPKNEQLENGARQGKNDFRKLGYNGPCPPAGKVHRYYFRLYALDSKVDLPAGSGRPDLDKAIAGHTLAQGEYMGTFKR